MRTRPRSGRLSEEGCDPPGIRRRYTIIDMDKEGVIDVNGLHSKNKPSHGTAGKLKAMPVCTIVRGRVQMRDGEPTGSLSAGWRPLL